MIMSYEVPFPFNSGTNIGHLCSMMHEKGWHVRILHFEGQVTSLGNNSPTSVSDGQEYLLFLHSQAMAIPTLVCFSPLDMWCSFYLSTRHMAPSPLLRMAKSGIFLKTKLHHSFHYQSKKRIQNIYSDTI